MALNNDQSLGTIGGCHLRATYNIMW